MARRQQQRREIPPFRTEQEEADWWDKHGPSRAGVPADVVLSDGLGNIVLIEFKFSADEFRALAHEADRSYNGDFVALIRSWVQARTEELMEAR